MLELSIPTAAKASAADSLEYSYITQEKLRLLHNQQGADFKAGKISKDDWEAWKKEYFAPRSDAICVEIIKNRQALLSSTRYSPDLEKDFISKVV